MAKLEQKVEDMDLHVGEKLTAIEKKLDAFIESAEKKFASKLTERIVYGLCALILAAFITKLTGLW